MSSLRTLTKSAEACARYSLKNHAHAVFKNSQNVVTRQDRLKSSDKNLTDVYGEYNTHLYIDKNRYVIKDKSTYAESCKALRNIKKNMEENTYFLKKSSQKKSKYFENFKNMQDNWREIKRKQNIWRQQRYDHEQPSLWMTVKDKYLQHQQQYD